MTELTRERESTPVPGCKVCTALREQALLSLPSASVLLPGTAHIAPSDGGHLQVAPIAHVPDRRSLSPAELLAVDWGTLLAAEALRRVFGTDWQNYQENGNWGLDSEITPHMHVHVYGRKRSSLKQPFGESLRFPPRAELSHFGEELPDARQQEELVSALAEGRRTQFPDYHRFFDPGERTP
jgi:diadenosine tetraphosphate (Ap4A) HIT family hydrolase